MHLLRRSPVIALLSFVSIVASGQEVSRQVQTVTGGEGLQGERKPKKELTSEERKTAASLLKISEAEARALKPDLRAYALLQVARGYSQVSPSKAPALLKDAFLATTEIS